jgi:hypothetical protein
LNGVPSWNFTPLRNWKVQSFAFFEVQLFASAGWMSVVPGFSLTRLSKICSVTRNDSPSETSAGSRYVGSAAPANTSVVALEAPPAVLAAINTASAAKGRASLLTFPLTQSPFVVPPPKADVQV